MSALKGVGRGVGRGIGRAVLWAIRQPFLWGWIGITVVSLAFGDVPSLSGFDWWLALGMVGADLVDREFRSTVPWFAALMLSVVALFMGPIMPLIFLVAWLFFPRHWDLTWWTDELHSFLRGHDWYLLQKRGKYGHFVTETRLGRLLIRWWVNPKAARKWFKVVKIDSPMFGDEILAFDDSDPARREESEIEELVEETAEFAADLWRKRGTATGRFAVDKPNLSIVPKPETMPPPGEPHIEPNDYDEYHAERREEQP